ncbi:adrenocortical dysplasia protein homolog [Melopsittacus undulatus]|uniref:Shelterin complex subunit TPP1/Est3 domain-containing protein n=1 Tax=Melopsittacus undulatus TaxID=13146 RepID=A0A8C6IMM5_MELUD|nr:adrenocortical dysplasia protein homolog [Melopsittacus undulatus]
MPAPFPVPGPRPGLDLAQRAVAPAVLGEPGGAPQPCPCPPAAQHVHCPSRRFVYENKNMASHKVYMLDPWVNNLLLNYEQMDLSDNLLAGQVLQVLHDSAVPGQPEAVQDAVLQVSDGSYYIRVIIAAEALQSEKNTHTQIKLSSLICRIVILQKYTVCFQEEVRPEDCEFYLRVQKFIVLPIEMLRLESSDGNKEPSVMQKVKKLWLRSLAESDNPSSESSLSQLIDAIRQNHLEDLKESAEVCLDLGVPKMMPATGKDEVPVTQWEAVRKQGQGEDTFIVPANILVVPPEEGAVACDSSRAETSEATPRESGDGSIGPSELSVISQPSSVVSTALSESLEGSMDTPWDRLPPVCLTMSCSGEKTLPQDPPLKTKQDVAADSKILDILELCSQDSSEGRSPGVPVQTSSPLLGNYGNANRVKTSTTQAPSAMEAACDAPNAAQGPQVLGSSEATPTPPSPVTTILPSSQLQALTEGMPHKKQAGSSVTAFPPDTLEHGQDCVRFLGGGAVGARRKLLEGNGQTQPAHHKQQHPRRAPRCKRREVGIRLKPVSTQSAKKSRKEEAGLQHVKELSEKMEEEAAVESGPSSQAEQHKALQPCNEKPLQYKYEAPSPGPCEQIRSIGISKVTLEWACWILMEKDVDS